MTDRVPLIVWEERVQPDPLPTSGMPATCLLKHDNVCPILLSIFALNLRKTGLTGLSLFQAVKFGLLKQLV